MAQISRERLIFISEKIQYSRYTLVAPYSIVLWDFLAVLPREIKLIYLSHEPWTPLKFFYFLGRFLPIVLWPVIIWLMVRNHTLEDCMGFASLLTQHTIFMILQLVPHSILAIRAYAYTGRTKKIRLLLILGMCIYLGTQLWAYLLSGTRQLNHKIFKIVGRTGCFGDPRASRRPFAWVILTGTVVDCVSIGLTIFHAITTMGVDGRLGRLFIQQGISLFVFMFCTNIVVMISFFDRPSKPWGSACFTIVLLLPNVIACRFILELRELTTNKAEGDLLLVEFERAVDDYLARENAGEMGQQSAFSGR